MPIPTRSASVRIKGDNVKLRQASSAKWPDAAVRDDVRANDDGNAVPRPAGQVSDSPPRTNQVRHRTLPRPPVVASSGVQTSQISKSNSRTVHDGIVRATSIRQTTRSVSQVQSDIAVASQQRTLPLSTTTKAANTHLRSTSTTTVTGAPKAQASRITQPGPQASSTFRQPSTRLPTSKPVNPTYSSSTYQKTETATASLQSLRDELLQLRLVHLPSARNLSSFEVSARAKIEVKQAALHDLQSELYAAEKVHAEGSSLSALQTWLRHNELPDERQIQILSRTITELTDIINQPERLRCLDEFNMWLNGALAIRHERTSPSPGDDHHDDYRDRTTSPKKPSAIHSLGLEWRDEMYTLRQQVELASTTLEQLSNITKPITQASHSDQDQPGITLVLTSHETLAKTLLDQIDTALRIEKMVVAEEQKWQATQVNEALVSLLSHDDARDTRDGGRDERGKCVGPEKGIWAR